MNPLADNRHEALRRFYQAIDDKEWDQATAQLAETCRWHILANDVVDAASVEGPQAVGRWFRKALGELQTAQQILRIEDEGAASVVFTRAEVISAQRRSISSWVDVFRFDGPLIVEHVSLQI